MQERQQAWVSTTPFPLWARPAQNDLLPHHQNLQSQNQRQHSLKCQECQHQDHHERSHDRPGALHTIIGKRGLQESLPFTRRLCLHSPSHSNASPAIQRLSPVASRLHTSRRCHIQANGKNTILRQRQQPSQLRYSQARLRFVHFTAPAAHPTRTPEATTTIDASSRISLSPPPAADSNTRFPSPSQQPSYPGATTPTPPLPSPIPVPLPVPGAARLAPDGQPRRNNSFRRAYAHAQQSFLQSPFRTRGAAAALNAGPFQRPLRRLSAARLWNPTNSTPRGPDPSASARRRRPSTPPPPAVPLNLPSLDLPAGPAEPPGTGTGDHPLLTLPEVPQNRLTLTTRASLQFERSAGSEQRVNLPRSVRHSYDGKRASITPSPVEDPGVGPSLLRVTAELPEPNDPNPSPVGLSFEPTVTGDQQTRTKLDKGKGKAIMSPHADDPEHGRGGFSHDLERGMDGNPRYSTASRVSGIGSAITSSSDDSSIMGDPDQQPDTGEEWGPQHPCFPHLNPHVPIDSPEYVTTRIIRVRRDWLLQGDLAPTFSNLYPEILDPAGLSEQEFRRVIEKLNGELVPIFSPYNWRNILDGVLGVATGWLWEDLGLTGVKARLKKLEKWIEDWNLEMEKSIANVEGAVPPKIIPLRRTGYMTLDIQIPDPEIAPAPPSTPGASRNGPIMPIEPPAAVTA
ncbi:Golgin subfamily A member 7/ERF4 family-domain-containing protein [Rhypophila decipiens]|uniref:Ras modification protein ERF4 n=1 Tax=Rhypophila decipiens TaxID=261697 RepID=A0AAN6YCP8_9PEZI|nr:Golgin subfamily A member 7/ERF4 family-domain-containing protein [Rhypophila decipiens]